MVRKNYYNLSFKEVQDGLIICHEDFKGINREVLLEGTFISYWPSNVTLFVQGKNPTDYLFYPLAPWFTVSRRVKEVLEAENIGGIQFLPVQVEHRSGIFIPGYSILNVCNLIPALDYEHTEWITTDHEHVQYPQLNIWKVALQMKLLEKIDIFRLAELRTEIYVSETFKNCLEQNKASLGFSFLHVPTYD
jgi:hypothetical protein